jgi:hypothetical protein
MICQSQHRQQEQSRLVQHQRHSLLAQPVCQPKPTMTSPSIHKLQQGYSSRVPTALLLMAPFNLNTSSAFPATPFAPWLGNVGFCLHHLPQQLHVTGGRVGSKEVLSPVMRW